MTASRTATDPAVTVIPALDGLRALAAGLVVLTHAAFLTGFGASGGLVGRLWARGDFGVGIFFALSGFLLHRGFLAKAGRGGLDVVGYTLRRAARVLPAYWVTLAAVVVFAHPPLRDWLLHAALLHIYVPDAWISSFGQSWSLATEISFYAVLPLVVIALLAHDEAEGGLGVGDDDLLALPEDLTLVGAVHTGERLDERRFAGAVLTEHAVHFAGDDLEVDSAERAHACEGLCHASDGE